MAISGGARARRAFSTFGLACLLALLAGCAALPDVGGYAAATIDVKQAVVTAGDAVQAELKPPQQAAFAKAWAATAQSLDGLIDYAESIEQIVAAGNRGAESAKEVAGAVDQLVQVFAVTVPGATVAGKLIADTGGFIYGEIAKARAAATLEDALARSSPVIEQMAVLAQGQIADARRLFGLQIARQTQALETSGSGYGDWITAHQMLETRSQALAGSLARLVEMPTTPRSAQTARKIAEAQAGLAEIAAIQQQYEPHLAEYRDKLEAITQRRKAGLELLGATDRALAVWAQSHGRLVTAVRTRQPVSLESLLAAVSQVQALTQRWREL